MQRLDELERMANSAIAELHDDRLPPLIRINGYTILNLIDSIRAKDLVFRNIIRCEYATGGLAEAAIEQTEKDWGTLEGQDKTEGKEL